MRKGLCICTAVILIAGLFMTANAKELGLMTGSKKGTYYQFGLDMKELSKQYGFDVHPYNSKGSIENVYAVYKRPKTQMGIVQSDVLAFVLKVQSNKMLKRIAKKTKMVFPLYNEEVHLLGDKKIMDFDDLDGKKVAIGKEGSGTYLTAKLLFEVSGIVPAELIPIGTTEALAQIKTGNIDAMFYVAGVPVKLFMDNVTINDGLHLVSITNKSITEFYPVTEINEGTYPWQESSVSTVAVKAVLVSFDFRRSNCDSVGEFAGCIYKNIDWLKENGHPKWRSVDLEYPLKGWEQYDCVKKYLGKKVRISAEGPVEKNPLLEAIKDIL